VGESALTQHALTLSVALFAAYLFTRISHVQHFSVENLRTDRFAFHLLGFAALFVGLGAYIGDHIHDFAPRQIRAMAPDVEVVGITPTTLNAIFVALLFGIGDNLRILWLMRRDPAVLRQSGWRRRIRMAAVSRYIGASNDPMLRTLFRAVILKKFVMLTLKNHKVYVGLPLSQMETDPTKAFTSIRLYPLASGSRNRTTKNVVLPVRYSDLSTALEPIPGGTEKGDRSDIFFSSVYHLLLSPTDKRRIDIEDMGVVVLWNQLHSMTIFDPNVYNWFQQQQSAKRPTVSPHESWLKRRQAKRALRTGYQNRARGDRRR
jgi:hypothetical protein